MFFSVIVPCYNEEKYIEKCLISINSQTFKDFEIIVVDNNSRDNSYEIAKKYTERVYILKERGIAKARNYGAKMSNGKYLVFMDADVVILPNTLEIIYKFIKRNKFIGCTLPKLPLEYDPILISSFIIYNHFVEELSIKINKPTIAGSFCCYDKSIFERVGGFDERLKVLEDFDLSKRISKFGKIAYIKEIPVLTSARRIRKWGLFKSFYKYSSFYLKSILSKEFLSKAKYEIIR